MEIWFFLGILVILKRDPLQVDFLTFLLKIVFRSEAA